MKATGEVMAIGNTFEDALMKAVRSLELGMLDSPALSETLEKLTTKEVMRQLHVHDSERAFLRIEALKRGMSHETIHASPRLTSWFLAKMQDLGEAEATDPGRAELRRPRHWASRQPIAAH